MRIYEELFIVRPDAPEEEIDQLIEQLTTHIAGDGGNVPFYLSFRGGTEIIIGLPHLGIDQNDACRVGELGAARGGRCRHLYRRPAQALRLRLVRSVTDCRTA